MPTALQNVSEETRDELAALALKMSGNKGVRKEFLNILEKVSPETPIPELEFERRLQSEMKPVIEELTKTKNSFEEFKLGTAMVEMKKGVMEKHGLNAEQMTKMEERMGKKELPMDYEFAARLYKQEAEPATPTNYGTSGYGPFGLEKNAKEFEGLMENENDWGVTQAHQIIDEMQKKGRTPAF